MEQNKENSLKKEMLERDNFSWHEFFASETAKREGIYNRTKDQKVLASMMVLADKMQEIRDLLGFPIRINSGFRSLELNKKLGSKDTSQHIRGQACDFICPSFGTSEEIVRKLKECKIEVDQALEEGRWVHLSIKDIDNRNQFAYYIDGRFTLMN